MDLGIPLDAQWGDIDIMDRFLHVSAQSSFRWLDFTYDPESFAGLPDFVRGIQEEGYKYQSCHH